MGKPEAPVVVKPRGPQKSPISKGWIGTFLPPYNQPSLGADWEKRGDMLLMLGLQFCSPSCSAEACCSRCCACSSRPPNPRRTPRCADRTGLGRITAGPSIASIVSWNRSGIGTVGRAVGWAGLVGASRFAKATFCFLDWRCMDGWMDGSVCLAST